MATAQTIERTDQPVRRCIVSGERAPVEKLVRFVVGPDGDVVPDVAAKLPGRGLWLRAERDMIRAASAGDAFAKSARRQVSVPPDLADQVERMLKRHCLSLVGLARRSGQALVGYEKVRAALASGRVGALIEARDGAPGGRAKLAAQGPAVPVIELFDGAELGAALGREHAVHVALLKGRMTDKILTEAARAGAACGQAESATAESGTET